MKLLDTEATILACVELNANMSVEQIRKATGYRPHTIRYALKKLIKSGLVRYMPYINMGALGLTEYNIFFSLGTPQPSIRAKFLSHLQRLKNVTWIAELGGDYQYGISIIARSTSQLQDILDLIPAQFGGIFLDKVSSSQFSYSLLPRKYLSGKDFRQEPLVNRPLDEKVKIDDLDKRIIAGLVASNFESHRQIAMRLNIPLSTMELRVKGLEQKGVIQGYIFDLDISRINVQHYKLLLFARGMSLKFKEAIREFAARNRSVVYLVECFGNWDIELGVEVVDPREVTPIVQSLQDQFGSFIHGIKVLNKFRDLKSLTYPIDIAEGGSLLMV